MEDGKKYKFDHVVIATHANQALSLLLSPTPQEAELLGKWKYTSNRTVLHTDTSLMPKRRRIWGSWNFVEYKDQDNNNKVSVTYWMNRLQSIKGEKLFFVSLNPPQSLKKGHILAENTYEHPLFDNSTLEAQKKLWSIQGQNRTWYCGSYFGSGFHEDGLQSGLDVAEILGRLERPWASSGQNPRISINR